MKIGKFEEPVQAAVRSFRLLLALAVLLTLVSLLTSGEQVLAFKQWVASWLPFAGQIYAWPMARVAWWFLV